MGMSENIQDLYLLDFVLKDRDRFIITFSGFIYARLATQKERESLDNYFDYADLSIKVLESIQPKYKIHFIIIEEGKRNLMKHLKFTIFNWCTYFPLILHKLFKYNNKWTSNINKWDWKIKDFHK